VFESTHFRAAAQAELRIGASRFLYLQCPVDFGFVLYIEQMSSIYFKNIAGKRGEQE
jgi:hypothetical protein